MIRRILLPVDCSEQSTVACDYAIELAKRHGAVIWALGVVDVPGIVRSATTVGAGASHYGKELCERRLDDARSMLGGCLDTLKERAREHEVKLKRIHESGAVHAMIAQHSRFTDFVVVAEGINFEFETSHTPGDTLFKLLKITSRLTMTTPGKVRPVRKVVMAHDLTPACSRVLYLMMQIDPFPDAEYVVVHADREGMADGEDFTNIVDYIREHGHEAEMVVRNIKPSKAILEVAEEREADAIVMGAYDVGKVERFLWGSTAKKILDKSEIPVVFGI